MTTRISQTFQKLKHGHQMAFMPFVTLGDPDLATSRKVLESLGAAGVDLIEVGFPYSDPIADGPVIQASYNRALARNVHVDEIFAMLQSCSKELPPLVGMVAYAIIFRYGAETFLSQASRAGLCGLIVPDLPGDDAQDFALLVQKYKLDLIPLIAPTTRPERAEAIAAVASGFLYCISVAGITGVRDELPAELRNQLLWLKTKTAIPLAVGFGIKSPEHISQLRGVADGAIVGSAFVKFLGQLAAGEIDQQTMLSQIQTLAIELTKACHHA